jgi:hypothetical protein
MARSASRYGWSEAIALPGTSRTMRSPIASSFASRRRRSSSPITYRLKSIRAGRVVAKPEGAVLADHGVHRHMRAMWSHHPAGRP